MLIDLNVKTRIWLKSAVACSLLLLATVAAQVAPARESRRNETVAPGVEHVEIRRGDFASDTQSDRWTIHALVVDPRQARLQIAQAADEIVGAETTSSIAARRGALAAINGGYFRTSGPARGEPIGVFVLRGKLLSESVKQRAALAINDDGKQTRAAIALVDAKATLLIDGQPARAINGINRPREANDLVVFTPEYHRKTLTDAEGIEVVVSSGRIAAVHDQAGDTMIPRNGFVLSAKGAAARWARTKLRRGAKAEIKTAINARPAFPFKPDFILGGGPRLLSNGQFVAHGEAASYAQSFYPTRHPRTALGWRADGKLVLVTVDGRQRDSAGMSIAELARLMQQLGCREAINLDGGGSTTMVIRNRIVNRPSDLLGERPVSDALLVLKR